MNWLKDKMDLRPGERRGLRLPLPVRCLTNSTQR